MHWVRVTWAIIKSACTIKKRATFTHGKIPDEKLLRKNFRDFYKLGVLYLKIINLGAKEERNPREI